MNSTFADVLSHMSTLIADGLTAKYLSVSADPTVEAYVAVIVDTIDDLHPWARHTSQPVGCFEVINTAQPFISHHIRTTITVNNQPVRLSVSFHEMLAVSA